MLPPAMKLKKLIKENEVKPNKVIDINALDIGLFVADGKAPVGLAK